MKNTFIGAKLGLGIATLALAINPAFGADLMFSYSDPVGDATGQIDVTSMVVVFNNATGKFKITLTSTAAQPFLNQFRVNSNLFNPSRLPSHSLFADNLQDYNLATPKTKLVLTGTNANLTSWQAGDVVATNTAGSGGLNPPGSTLYRTSVANVPFTFLTNEDAIAYGPNGHATITALTPQAAMSGLMDDVQVWAEAGVLNGGQANSLYAKLSAILSSLNKGNTKPACNQLQAFINEVTSLMNGGAIPVTEAQAVIQEAAAASGVMGCQP